MVFDLRLNWTPLFIRENGSAAGGCSGGFLDAFVWALGMGFSTGQIQGLRGFSLAYRSNASGTPRLKQQKLT